MSGKQAPLIISQEAGVDYTPGDMVGARVGVGDVGRAAFSLARLDTPTSAIWDSVSAAMKDVDGEQIPADQLNQEFGLDNVFQVPMTKDAAAVIAERVTQRKRAEEVLSRAEQGIVNTTVSFGASIAANLMDPVNLAADVMVSKGLGAIARSGKIAAMANWGSSTASMGRRLTEAAAEGALGGIAVEPLVIGGRSLENKDRDLDEAAVEILAGAIAFPAAKIGGEAILSRGLKFWNGLDNRSMGNLYRSAKAQLMSGKKIDVEPLTREQIKMTSEYEVPAGKALFGEKVEYVYSPKTAPQAGDRFYVSVTNNVDNLDMAKFGTFADDYGGAINVTDNAFAANGASARFTGDSIGNILEVEIDPSVKILDLETKVDSLDPETMSAFSAAYKKAIGEEPDFASGKTLKELYDDMYDGIVNENYRSDVVKAFNDSMKEAGFSGYRHDGSKLAGMAHNQHNVLAMFDTQAVKVLRKNAADPSFVKRLSNQERIELVRNALDDNKPGFWSDDKSAKQVEAELDSFKLDSQRMAEEGIDDPDLMAFRELDPEQVDADIEAAFKEGVIDDAEYKKFKSVMQEKNATADAHRSLFECIYGIGAGE